MDGVGGFAVGGVDVLAIFVGLEAVDIDRAESTMNDGDDADIFGQAHDRFANSTVNLRLKIFGAFAGEIDHGLACADIYFEPGEVHFRQTQIAFTGAYIDFQLNGNAVGNFQVPDVIRVADDAASAFLGDGEIAAAVFHFVFHFRGGPSSAMRNIRVEQRLAENTAFEA